MEVAVSKAEAQLMLSLVEDRLGKAADPEMREHLMVLKRLWEYVLNQEE